jgi:hypothetical protein
MEPTNLPQYHDREVYILLYWHDPVLRGQIVHVDSGKIYPISDPEALLALIQKQVESAGSKDKSSGLK